MRLNRWENFFQPAVVYIQQSQIDSEGSDVGAPILTRICVTEAAVGVGSGFCFALTARARAGGGGAAKYG